MTAITILQGICGKKIKNEEKASGIETERTNLEKALEDLIEREDAAESEQRVADDQKKQDRENFNHSF